MGACVSLHVVLVRSMVVLVVQKEDTKVFDVVGRNPAVEEDAVCRGSER